jgi:hypothetical protein
MRTLVLGLVLLLATSTLAHAQSGGSLLGAEAPAGDRLTVTMASGARLRGRLVRDAGGTLVVRGGDRDQALAHGEVLRVDRYRNRFLYGPLIGLGAGLAAGIPVKRRLDNEAGNGDAWLRIFAAIGVGAGSVIDLFNGSTRTIYSRTPQPSTDWIVLPQRSGFALGVRRVF